MKLIKKVKGLMNFYLCRGEEVLIYKDKIHIGDKVFDVNPKDDYYVENDCLTKGVLGKDECQLYNGESFEDEKVVYGGANIYFAPDVYYSRKREDYGSKYSFMEHGKEYLFEVEAEDSFKIAKYDFNHSILMLPQSDDRKLFFYTKTGERLWVFEEEEVVDEMPMKIVREFPVVDDVVVIISRILTEDIYKAQGFKIRTGEKLWELRDNDCPDDLFLGEDKKLYGCYSYYDNLMLYCIDPFSGKMEGFAVKTNDEGINVCPWNVSMHNNCLFYGSNRPGCELGVIDCGKRELVEAIPLKFKKGCQVGAPIVSDGKVYVFSRGAGELRVYEL
jgi:hypothetical protein